MPFAATRMCLEIVILNAMIQKEKNKCHVLSHTWNQKYSADEFNYGIETDSLTQKTSLLLQKGKSNRGEIRV